MGGLPVGRGTGGLVITCAVMATLRFGVVATREPEYIPAVAIVVALLLFALVLRIGRDPRRAQRVAVAGLVLGAVYIASLIGLRAITEQKVRAELAQQGLESVERLMVGPVPANPFAWDIVAELGDHYRYGRFTWSRQGSLDLADTALPRAEASFLCPDIEARGQALGLRRRVTFPWPGLESAGPP